MGEYETFQNAPITEALIDLRVTFEDNVALDQLDQLSDKFLARFPRKESRTEHEYSLNVEIGTSASESRTRSRQVGYVLFSENKDRSVQLRVDGFAFSKMKPYENWSSLSQEAQEHWETYRDALSPSKVVRLAVRNINRIELPVPVTDFQDYIRTGPQVADGIPQGFAEFFSRVVIPNPDNPQMLSVVTSTMEEPDQERKLLPYIFDIDTFEVVELAPNSDDIWPTLGKLRGYKNLIFFKSMTDRAKELFR